MTAGIATRPRAFVVAIVGAESTGKTTLARDLAQRLGEEATQGPPRRCTAVDEWLRTWCTQHRRTPRADEQRAIAAEQARRIEAVAGGVDVLVCDTTPLMTAIYSQLLFDDRSLTPEALAWQEARCDLTLLTATDLPWVADGWMRDGPAMQQRVDAALRSVLMASPLPWCVVGGLGPDRVSQALAAVNPALARRASGRQGLFTGLHADRTAAHHSAADTGWSHACTCCDSPEHERADMLARRRERLGVRR